MRYAAMSAMQSAVFMGGVLTLAVAGAQLRLDRRLGEFYIDVWPDFDREGVRRLEAVADEHGYEAMPEWECAPEELHNGATRHWFVEKEEVLHERSLQAV